MNFNHAQGPDDSELKAKVAGIGFLTEFDPYATRSALYDCPRCSPVDGGPGIAVSAAHGRGPLQAPSASSLNALAPLAPTRHLSDGGGIFVYPYAFKFTPEPVNASAVPESQAVVQARSYADAVPSDVTETVYFGKFESSVFQPQDAWLFVYSGPGVDLRLGGLYSPRGSADPTRDTNVHEDAVAIDAATGRFMESDVGSNMPPLSTPSAVTISRGNAVVKQFTHTNPSQR